MYTPDDSTETILVVDDAEEIRKMVCAMLLQSGYRALEASDGSEALRTLEQDGEQVNLVVTDLVMPEMNGRELAQRISEIRPGLPIIFMSGYSDQPITHGVSAKDSLFLAKPFTPTKLMEQVRQALGPRPPAGKPPGRIRRGAS